MFHFNESEMRNLKKNIEAISSNTYAIKKNNHNCRLYVFYSLFCICAIILISFLVIVSNRHGFKFQYSNDFLKISNIKDISKIKCMYASKSCATNTSYVQNLPSCINLFELRKEGYCQSNKTCNFQHHIGVGEVFCQKYLMRIFSGKVSNNNLLKIVIKCNPTDLKCVGDILRYNVGQNLPVTEINSKYKFGTKNGYSTFFFVILIINIICFIIFTLCLLCSLK